MPPFSLIRDYWPALVSPELGECEPIRHLHSVLVLRGDSPAAQDGQHYRDRRTRCGGRGQNANTVGTSSLAPLLHHEPAALFLIQVECLHGCGLGARPVRGIDEAQGLGALADQRRTPGAKRGACLAFDLRVRERNDMDTPKPRSRGSSPMHEPQASPEHHDKHRRHSDSDRNIKQSIAHGSPLLLGQASARHARKLLNGG